jgi:hypothetical protein
MIMHQSYSKTMLTNKLNIEKSWFKKKW